MTPHKPSRIFLSYRRGDTAGHVGRLHEELVRYFGRHRVFMDIDGIKPGEDFLDVLQRRLDEAAVVLVVMGTRWVGPNTDGTRRVDDVADFVRLEVATALQRESTLVIPVLVDNAKMLEAKVLPEPLQSLSRRNAIELSDVRWKQDVHMLFDAIQPSVPLFTGTDNPVVGKFRRPGPRVIGLLLLALVLMIWRPWKSSPMEAAMQSAGVSTDIPRAIAGRQLPSHVLRDAKKQLKRARSDWMDDAYMSAAEVDCDHGASGNCQTRFTFVSDSRRIGLSAWLSDPDGKWQFSQLNTMNSQTPIELDIMEIGEALTKAKSYGLSGNVDRVSLKMHRGNDKQLYPIWLIFPTDRSSVGNDTGFCMDARTGQRIGCWRVRG